MQGSQTDSPHLGIIKENQQKQNSPGLHRSFDSALPKTPDKLRLSPPPLEPPGEDQEVERRRAEAERLLEEAVSSWKEAQEVLQEVKELQSQTLRRQRRKTYEKMTTSAAAALQPAATAATAAGEEDDTPTSPTSPEDDEESETP